MQKRFHSAFSLIEISVVIMIVGVLIAAIVQTSKIVKKSRLATAQSLTQSSPLVDAHGLVAWYETSLENSFIETEIVDGGNISTWYDKNSQAITKNNALQATSGNQPKYYIDVFNGAIPALRFDGTDDFMTFDGNGLIGTSYTVFIVEQRRAAGGDLPMLGGNNGLLNNNLHLLYRTDTLLVFAQYANDLVMAAPAYTSPTPRIHTFNLNTTIGKRYWQNGGDTPDGSAAQTATLAAYAGSAIGRYMATYYNGDIAEIIIFNRSLPTEERQAIEIYLGKKYGITIS